MDSRIIEIKEIYELASSLEIVLGDEIPNIKTIINQLENNVKRSGNVRTKTIL